MCASVASEHGGHGLDLTSYLVLVEELAYCWGSLRSSVTTHNMVASILAEFGSEGQRRRHLPELPGGTTIGFFGLTEPNVGSDAAGVECLAERSGDGYRLNGSK